MTIVEKMAYAIATSMEYDWKHLKDKSNNWPEDRESLRKHAQAAFSVILDLLREPPGELIRGVGYELQEDCGCTMEAARKACRAIAAYIEKGE